MGGVGMSDIEGRIFEVVQLIREGIMKAMLLLSTLELQTLILGSIAIGAVIGFVAGVAYERWRAEKRKREGLKIDIRPRGSQAR